jgi:hypothetical protein
MNLPKKHAIVLNTTYMLAYPLISILASMRFVRLLLSVLTFLPHFFSLVYDYTVVVVMRIAKQL